jgi:hypothetical protein
MEPVPVYTVEFICDICIMEPIPRYTMESISDIYIAISLDICTCLWMCN